MAGPAYREYPLAAPLDRFVDAVWVLSQQIPLAKSCEIQRIPPDGSVEVIFHLREPFFQLDHERAARQPGAMVVGVWTQPIALVSPGSFDTLGIRLKPGAASAFWAGPVAAFTDTVVDASALWGRAATMLRDQLAEAGDITRRLALVEDFLLARLRRADRALAAPIGRIVASCGRAPLDSIARDAGVSHRQLERSFRAHVGVSPKMLSRIVRFQRVLRHSTPDSAGAWADVALGCGYADQSHLIRDFTQFAGETPAALAAAEPELADYFRRR